MRAGFTGLSIRQIHRFPFFAVVLAAFHRISCFHVFLQKVPPNTAVNADLRKLRLLCPLPQRWGAVHVRTA